MLTINLDTVGKMTQKSDWQGRGAQKKMENSQDLKLQNNIVPGGGGTHFNPSTWEEAGKSL